MSAEATLAVMTSDLTDAEFRVLALIAFWQKDSSAAVEVSIDELAEKIQKSTRQTRKILRRLDAAGRLECCPLRGIGRYVRTKYRVMV